MTNETDTKMGRPKLLSDEHQWQRLCDLIPWANADYCAEQLGVSVDTLYRRIREKENLTFAEFQDKRMESIRMNLRVKQYKIATEGKGNVTLLIWLGKQLLNQTDKIEKRLPTSMSLGELQKEAEDILAAIKVAESNTPKAVEQ